MNRAEISSLTKDNRTELNNTLKEVKRELNETLRENWSEARETVDEKLTKTLNGTLLADFRPEQTLKAYKKGIGEMQTLATDGGD